MTELYWITRLEAINGLLCFMFIISFILAIIFLIRWLADGVRKCKKFFIGFVFMFGMSLLAYVLVPTEKEAYLIYGVGGTIDYLKSNETAKKLPDKCIQALDKAVNEYLKE